MNSIGAIEDDVIPVETARQGGQNVPTTASAMLEKDLQIGLKAGMKASK